jgi:hypothetical protein
MSARSNQASWISEFAVPPSHLFKYVSVEGDDRAKWARQLIVESELFFARPGLFNDPLDCKTPPSFDGEEADIKRYWRERWERTGKGYEEKLEWFVAMTKTDEGRGQLTKYTGTHSIHTVSPALRPGRPTS